MHICAIRLMLGSDKEKSFQTIMCYMVIEEIIFDYTSDLSNQLHWLNM